MKSMTRRALLVGSGAVAGAAAAKFWPSEGGAAGTWPAMPDAQGAIILNDASELNPTRVAKHITLTQSPDAPLIEAVRREIGDARAAGRPFAAAAARHSMGAQSLPNDGTAITLNQEWLDADTSTSTYRVAAGVRWRTVIAQLDRIGYSPAVMQSNNDFGVASTFCVNAHGWPVPFGPFGSTVRSFRMIVADGELIECSREQNRELFTLAMGGYGLSGVIIDLVVDMVPNQMLTPSFMRIRANDFAAPFVAAASGGDGVAMAYGRLNVAPSGFLDEALMITYASVPVEALPPASTAGAISDLSRRIYRAQQGSSEMKGFRWWMEREIAPMARGQTTRNSLINEPVAALREDDPARADILHEYFVPPIQFAGFLDACRDVIPASYQELMNVTLRYVRSDPESVLCYAPEHRIAAVMAFSQEKSARAEEDMARMTRSLIDNVIGLGGTYYLPYRPHATRAQFRRAYPRADDFVARKLAADPAHLFRNAMWDRYLSDLPDA